MYYRKLCKYCNSCTVEWCSVRNKKKTPKKKKDTYGSLVSLELQGQKVKDFLFVIENNTSQWEVFLDFDSISYDD